MFLICGSVVAVAIVGSAYQAGMRGTDLVVGLVCTVALLSITVKALKRR